MNSLENTSDFKDTLYNEALKINIELNKNQLEKFELYKNMLVEWNKKINLTAITDDYAVIMKHFIDCLEIVKYINEDKNIIDVGTGAGFPGIVIAIYFENKVNITLLDSLNKRLEFLEEVKKNLSLNNIKLVHARAEEYAHNEEYREMFDIVVSRAVAPLNILLEYDIPYIKKGGKALLLKGSNVNNEVEEAKNVFGILNCKLECIKEYNYLYNNEQYTRNILIINKYDNCPIKYPRNYGKIKKSPLK